MQMQQQQQMQMQRQKQVLRLRPAQKPRRTSLRMTIFVAGNANATATANANAATEAGPSTSSDAKAAPDFAQDDNFCVADKENNSRSPSGIDNQKGNGKCKRSDKNKMKRQLQKQVLRLWRRMTEFGVVRVRGRVSFCGCRGRLRFW
jgi:hypothetical protein